MKRTWRASRQACLAVLLCVGSTACATDPEGTQGASGALLFENALDPHMVGGSVKDYTGDGVPDLFMIVRGESGAAAAILTNDSGGGSRFLVRMLDPREVATPEVALRGTEVGRGDANELLARFEGLQDVVEELPMPQREGLGLVGVLPGELQSRFQCDYPYFCGWRDIGFSGDYWWVPHRFGVSNLGNWGWNDQTSSIYNTSTGRYRVSDNCNGCPAGDWFEVGPGDDDYTLPGWDNRMTALYSHDGNICWDTFANNCGY